MSSILAFGEPLGIASVPLTDEAWRPLAEGELLAVRAGEVLVTRGDHEPDSPRVPNSTAILT